jgi:hypothetical protein
MPNIGFSPVSLHRLLGASGGLEKHSQFLLSFFENHSEYFFGQSRQ